METDLQMNPHSDPSFCYARDLGWCEYDERGHSVPAIVAVIINPIGFSVFRFGNEMTHVGWFEYREDAIDYAVDIVRNEISVHELRQSDRD